MVEVSAAVDYALVHLGSAVDGDERPRADVANVFDGIAVDGRDDLERARRKGFRGERKLYAVDRVGVGLARFEVDVALPRAIHVDRHRDGLFKIRAAGCAVLGGIRGEIRVLEPAFELFAMDGDRAEVAARGGVYRRFRIDFIRRAADHRRAAVDDDVLGRERRCAGYRERTLALLDELRRVDSVCKHKRMGDRDIEARRIDDKPLLAERRRNLFLRIEETRGGAGRLERPAVEVHGCRLRRRNLVDAQTRGREHAAVQIELRRRVALAVADGKAVTRIVQRHIAAVEREYALCGFAQIKDVSVDYEVAAVDDDFSLAAVATVFIADEHLAAVQRKRASVQYESSLAASIADKGIARRAHRTAVDCERARIVRAVARNVDEFERISAAFDFQGSLGVSRIERRQAQSLGGCETVVRFCRLPHDRRRACGVYFDIVVADVAGRVEHERAEFGEIKSARRGIRDAGAGGAAVGRRPVGGIAPVPLACAAPITSGERGGDEQRCRKNCANPRE